MCETIVRILVRHAEKQEEKEYKIDPKIVVADVERARFRFESLLEQSGLPDKIICSPYERTRETAKIARDVIYESTGIQVPLSIDVELRDYVGTKKLQIAMLQRQIRPSTLAFRFEKETWEQYEVRIRKFIDKMLKDNCQNVWYITHGSFIKKATIFIKESANCTSPDISTQYPDTLSGTILKVKYGS